MFTRISGIPRIVVAGIALLSCSIAYSQAPAKKASPAGAAIKYKGIWEPAHVGEDIKLNDVVFVSENVGWVAGDKGSIFHTKDGGKTWAAQLGGDTGSSAEPVRSMRFLNATTGWAEMNGKLLRTTDGESWEVYGSLGGEYKAYYDWIFLSPTEGVQIIKEGGTIARTDDGGKTWRQVNPPCRVKIEAGGLPQNAACALKQFHFTSPEVGYATGSTVEPQVFFLLKTTDGGNSWSLHSTVPDVAHPHEPHFMQYVRFTDDTHGVAALPRGEKVLLTSDGGATWHGIVSQVKGPMEFADAQSGMSFDYGYGYAKPSISYTMNGGKTWITRQLVLPGAANALCVPRSDRAYLAGDHGMVFRYRVVPETTPNPPNSYVAPAMPRSTAGSQ